MCLHTTTAPIKNYIFSIINLIFSSHKTVYGDYDLFTIVMTRNYIKKRVRAIAIL